MNTMSVSWMLIDAKLMLIIIIIIIIIIINIIK